jgi:thiol-disulfide isomerase/thioredoxin
MKVVVNFFCKIIVAIILISAIPIVSFAQVPAAAGTAPDTAKIKPYVLLQYMVGRALAKKDIKAVDSILAGKPVENRTGIYLRVAAYLLENEMDLQMAEKYAGMAYGLSGETYAHPSDGNDRTISLSNLSKASEIMGCLAASKGDFVKAMRYFTETTDAAGSGSPKMETLYLLTVAHSDRYKTVKQKLESKVSSGDLSPEIKTAIQLVYNKENPNKADGFETYYDRLNRLNQSNGNSDGDQALSGLKAQMVTEPAPEFSLLDTEGNGVTRSSLKGKVVILDFWATWCVPCLASFPAMQRVVDKYKADRNVVFLFVNTMEKEKDVRSWIAKFKKEHNYPFRILLDNDSKVVSSYKSMGLPTKVIIDKNGMIRFTTTGFSGDSSLVSELVDMIELTKNTK